MKLLSTLLAIALLSGCASTGITPTSKQERIASGVETALSIGLVPVFTNNPTYLDAAAGVAATISATVGLDSITHAGVAAVLTKAGVDPKDIRTITGLVVASWDAYERDYKREFNMRADVALFLKAVSNGIARAIAATPK
jgi:hypothetical protein